MPETIESTESADRHEEIRVSQQPGFERRERVTEDVGASRRESLARVTQLIWLAAGALEVLIGLRIFLKLIAANPNNAFASFVYGFTDLFLLPFQGLTRTPSAGGMVLEIHAIIAMIVYALLAWILTRLIAVIFYRGTTRSVSVYERDQR